MNKVSGFFIDIYRNIFSVAHFSVSNFNENKIFYIIYFYYGLPFPHSSQMLPTPPATQINNFSLRH